MKPYFLPVCFLLSKVKQSKPLNAVLHFPSIVFFQTKKKYTSTLWKEDSIRNICYGSYTATNQPLNIGWLPCNLNSQHVNTGKKSV
jgi:hypothetical protein